MGSRRKGDGKVDGEDISTLVTRLQEFPSKEGGSDAGGSSRPKYSCKCCGARVDSGTHQCGLCQDAGCTWSKRRCRFA